MSEQKVMPRAIARRVAVTINNTPVALRLLQRLENNPAFSSILLLGTDTPAIATRRAEFHRMDLSQPQSALALPALLRERGINVFVRQRFFEAPARDAAWAHELEAIGAMYVLNACAEAGVERIIIGSSTTVYGAQRSNPNYLSEDHFGRSNPGPLLFEDRAEVERQAIEFRKRNPQVEVAVLRFATLLSEGVDNFMTRYLTARVTPVVMGFDPLVQFLHADDAVDAITMALDAGKVNGAYNIVGRGVLPLSAVIKLVGRMPAPVPEGLLRAGLRSAWSLGISDIHPRMARYLKYLWVADGRRAERELGFVAKYDVQDCLRDFRKGLESRGMIRV
ncbi:MAG: hypothetical protein GMKNLPBB_02060 [Myxococcota bacterium]|nr:hypothetical protein [Myxococcota bacterium]